MISIESLDRNGEVRDGEIEREKLFGIEEDIEELEKGYGRCGEELEVEEEGDGEEEKRANGEGG